MPQQTIQNLNLNTRYAAKVQTYSSLGVPSGYSEALDFQSAAGTFALGTPTNLVLSFDSPDLFASWTPPVGLVPAGYQVKISFATTTFTTEVSSPDFIFYYAQNVLTFGGLGQPVLNVSVQSIDDGGNLAPGILTGTAINGPPPTPTNPPSFAIGESSVWIEMTVPPTLLDFSGFHLQFSLDNTAWTDLGDTYERLNLYVNNTTIDYWYRYKTRDVFGQLSPDWSPSAQSHRPFMPFGSPTVFDFIGTITLDLSDLYVPPINVNLIQIIIAFKVPGSSNTEVTVGWNTSVLTSCIVPAGQQIFVYDIPLTITYRAYIDYLQFGVSIAGEGAQGMTVEAVMIPTPS